jgi:hypothetical protein
MPSPEIRREDFVLSMALIELPTNFLMLLFVAIIIEILGQNLLYITFFSGVLGFFAAGLVGTLAGLVIGAMVTIFCMLKLPKNNIVTQSWNTIWQ